MASYDKERLKAVRVVESLRSGIPTRYTTRELPDLRPDLMNTVRDDLERFAQDGLPTMGRLVWGEYGQGKSHLLTMVEHLALDMKFAVSFVTLSREVSCHNLFNFYRRVAPVVRHFDSNVPGLESELKQKKSSDLPSSPIQQLDRYPHRLPAIVMECMLYTRMRDEGVNDLYNDLIGIRLRLPEIRRLAREVRMEELLRDLPRFRIGDHAQAYFGVWADAIRFCGYRGWVILIDEVELIARLVRGSRLDAYRNLNWLLNWSGTMPFPIYTVGAAAKSLQEKVYGGTEFRPDDRSVIPQMAEERLGVEERDRMTMFFEHAVSDHCLTIGPVGEGDRDKLLQQLVSLHGKAHAWDPPDFETLRAKLSRLSEDAPIRTFIRGFLEALDQTLVTGQTPEIEPSTLIENPTDESPDFLAEEETGQQETVAPTA